MLIDNLNDFNVDNLYKCNDETHLKLLLAGFEPIYIDDEFYYYLLDSALNKYLNKEVFTDGTDYTFLGVHS